MTQSVAKSFWQKVVRWLWIPGVCLMIAVSLAGGTLFVLSETFAGHCCGLLVVLLGCIPQSIVLAFEKFKWRFVPLAAVSSIAAALLIIILCSAPTGTPGEESSIGQVFLRNDKFHRFSPFNIVPEIDQYKAGFFVGPKIGLLKNETEATRVSDVFMPLYREMEKRPEYRALGSVAGTTLSELWGGAFDVGHVYQYVPPHSAQSKMPAIIVLHGFGGNNKAYLYVWEQFGIRNQCIVLCPSFGFGFWRAGGTEAIERVRDVAVGKLNADPARIFLLGYSNGGLGVTRAITQFPDHYSGAVLFSPALDLSGLVTEQFKRAWDKRPILCITGTADNRIHETYVTEQMDQLKARGLNVVYDVVNGGDHFLMFESRERYFSKIQETLKITAKP